MAVKFNKLVHVVDDLGDPKRTEDGTYRLKTDWKKTAADRQGRKYNSHVHGREAELDDEGFLTVRRRSEKTNLIGRTLRTEAFVKKYKEPGYAYYLMNDEPGRYQQFIDNDWEPVSDKDGVAKIPLGHARDPGTDGILMKKPQEWYDSDQQRKLDINKRRFKQTSSPDEEQGQYEANPPSPLR